MHTKIPTEPRRNKSPTWIDINLCVLIDYELYYLSISLSDPESNRLVCVCVAFALILVSQSLSGRYPARCIRGRKSFKLYKTQFKRMQSAGYLHLRQLG